jgi:hypothetical protein
MLISILLCIMDHIIIYGIIWGGNSSYAINIFCVQKKALRIMAGIGNRNSCKQLFKTLRIFPLQSQYIYPLLCFVVNNMIYIPIYIRYT